MAVYYVDVLANEYLPQHRQQHETSCKTIVSQYDRPQREVVNLESIDHVPGTTPDVVKFVANEDDLMATLDEALRQLVAVRLDAAELGKHEV